MRKLPAFVMYAIAGATATATHFVVLWGLVELMRFYPGPASAIGAGCGAGVAYALNRHGAFAGSGVRHRVALPRFLLVAAVGALANGLLVWGLTALLGWYYLLAQACVTLGLLALTYQLNRRWTFGLGGLQ